MKQYQTLYLIIGILISMPLAMSTLSGIGSQDLPKTIISGSILLFWWSAYAVLLSSTRRSVIISLILPVLVDLVMMAQIFNRFLFMQKNGMEGPNGEGSPMAFLIGFTLEIGFIAVFTMVIIWGIRVLVIERNKLS